jgi:carboxyl-terminal processing protease
MTATVRALIAALIVVVIAGTGALYVGYRNGLAQRERTFAIDVADANASDALGNLSDPRMLANEALQKLETSYYKPIDPQVPIAGEEQALTAYLASKHIKNVHFPIEEANGDESHDGSAASSVLAYALENYGHRLGSDGSTDLTDAALRGILGSVKDPYTVYLSPTEIQKLEEQLKGGNFGGIGVYIYQLKDGEVVVQPIAGMPAAKAGVKTGDVVDTVDGKSVHGLTLDRVETMIRGESGTQVDLTMHPFHSKVEHTYSIVRAIIHVPTVSAKMEDGYDYIRLSDFGETSADEIKKALLDGKKHNARGYILDLRDNGGGYLEAAVKISSYFIPQGTIVSTIDRDGNKTVQEADGDAIGGLAPLVVLVNKYTASASEITSGALQDYHLATLIGTKTFGKGVVQSIYQMPNSGAMKITTARYVTPLGRVIQHKGIMPDVVVDQSIDPSLIDTPKDKQLAAAKAQLRKDQQ